MRGFELKKVVELFWKTTSVEEKTPIVRNKIPPTSNGTITTNQNQQTSNGTMTQNQSSDEVFDKDPCKKFADESIESRKEEKAEGMSLLRKICFFLSLNGGIMYVVVLGWLLPCRTYPCLESQDSWTTNLTNIRLTTGMETNFHVNPSLVIFGYSDDIGNKLGALQISDGKQVWNKVLIAEPKRVFCHAGGNNLKINGKESCIVTSNYFLAAFDAKDGSLIWERNSTVSERLDKIYFTLETENYLIGISNGYLHLIDSTNGTEISKMSLPCSWTVDIKIAGPWITETGFLWSLVCEYDDGMEAFTFKERELLDSGLDKAAENSSNDFTFKSLFSQQSYSGSIDLAGDVTTTPSSLVLSWADMVVMVTSKAPSHHLNKTWERRFSRPHGYHGVDVTSISAGSFTKPESKQVAAAVANESHSTVHIMEAVNGSSVAEIELNHKRIISMKNAAGRDGEADIIVLETIDSRNSSEKSRKETDTKSYYILQYESGSVVFKSVTTAEHVFDSNLSKISEGLSNLILASITEEGNAIINRHLIKNNPEHAYCKIEQSSNTSTVMFFE